MFNNWQPHQLIEVVDNEEFLAAKIAFIDALGLENIFTAWGSYTDDERDHHLYKTLESIKTNLSEVCAKITEYLTCLDSGEASKDMISP